MVGDQSARGSCWWVSRASRWCFRR